MREVVYLVVALATATPAVALEAQSRGEAGTATRRNGEASRLGLRVLAIPSRDPPAGRPVALDPRPACGGVCGLERSPAMEKDPRSRAVFNGSSLATATRGALAWALPGGLGLLAAGAFSQGTTVGQPASPVDTAVPAARATAALSLDLADSAGIPLWLNLAVESTWRLDGPHRMAHPLCGLRLDLTTAWAPAFSLQAPCGPVGHFGFGVRGRF